MASLTNNNGRVKKVFRRLTKIAGGMYEIELKPADKDDPIISDKVEQMLLNNASDETARELLEDTIQQINHPDVDPTKLSS